MKKEILEVILMKTLEKISFFIDDCIEYIVDAIFIADETRYGISLTVFAVCMVAIVVLAIIDRLRSGFTEKGITIGVLLLDWAIAVTSVMMCNFIFALIFTVIATIFMPRFEKNTVNEYLKKEVKTTPKKYLIYAVTSLVSFITALGILKFVLHTGPV